MKRSIQEILSRYGQMVMIHLSEGDVETKAFLQPVTSLDKRYYKEVVTEVGTVSEMRYLYLGPAEYDVAAFDTLICRSREFEAVSSEVVYGGNEPICCWALLRAI